MTSPGEIPPECPTCGKRQWPVIHSCRGVPAATAAEPTDGLLSDDWWTELFRATENAVDYVPYAAASEYPIPHVAAFRSAAEPLLAPLLAKLRAVEALAETYERQGEIAAAEQGWTDGYAQGREDERVGFPWRGRDEVPRAEESA